VNANGENPVEPNGAELLLRHYLERGTQNLEDINGSFNVAWWDEKACRLILANDKLGHRLLFWNFSAGKLAFASTVARVMAANVSSPVIDVRGFADLLTYGYILGERTLFRDVHVLQPASILTFYEGKIDIQQYWRLDQIEPYGRYDSSRLEGLEELFKKCVKRAIRPDLTCAVGLT
jgi:asparagine synthase (glutamine-hydrolysing)